jgi:hypothetical protein
MGRNALTRTAIIPALELSGIRASFFFFFFLSSVPQLALLLKSRVKVNEQHYANVIRG